MYKNFKSVLIVNFLWVLFFSCGGSSDNEIVVEEKPKNLVIEAVIKGKDASNPNGDGSGEVVFNFSATNATSYKLSFGDNETAETTNPSLVHTYKGSGVNTYVVYITAYKGSLFTSTNISITVKVNSNVFWSDEFDTDGAPDASKWGYNIGTGVNGWGNNEKQYYTNRSDNIKVEGGVLKIIAKKEDFQGSEYTSARIKTEGLFNFTYGRVEVRAKLPGSEGTWPAIWMLGSNFSSVGWPSCGEVDIMEQTGWDKNKVLATCHWLNTSNSQNASYSLDTSISNATTQFHVYAMEWNASTIKMFVDGTQYYVIDISNSGIPNSPFHNNFFLILNVAVGGTLGGTVPSNFTESTMEIDYVRVYQ